MKQFFLLLILLASVLGLEAKSLVLRLADGKEVYYPITTTLNPVMMLGEGTMTVNADAYLYAEVTSFAISDRTVGDVNNDGIIDIADVNGVVQAICGSTETAMYSDVNHDRMVDVSDINALITLIVSPKNISAVTASFPSARPSSRMAVPQAYGSQQRPQHIWIEFPADRTLMADSIVTQDLDSIVFTNSFRREYRGGKAGYKSYMQGAEYNFNTYFNRAIVIPSTYSTNDFNNAASKFCFERSQESEHFICFWEKGLTKNAAGNISLNGSTFNVTKLLQDAEHIWQTYVERLGFLSPGTSTTDRVKIEMFIVNQTAWRADGSGVDGKAYYISGTSTKKERAYKVGVFHCNPQAVTARGGHTVAHEIGHTFQYLVGVDNAYNNRTGKLGLNYVLGENSSGNEWWEDCANWQGYKVYPERQFTDGEYFEQYMDLHHLNIHHEAARYANCYYHDWWCDRHGDNTVAQIWREAVAYDDPTQTYMKLYGLNESTFADEQFEGYMRFTSFDIDNIRTYGKNKIGSELQRLQEPTEAIATQSLGGDNSWWVVSPDYCVENYGYNANPLGVPAEGTIVKATFKGIAGAPGYRNINKEYAGWRYGIAAYCADGIRVYSEIGRDREGEVSLTVPANCKNLWFVVMGAPTKYWTHSWNDNKADDEQWPYAVKLEGTDALGASRTYGEFPENYARHDTTVVINATLAYDAYNYSSVNVQYDTNAICQALGLSTAQLKAIKRNDTVSNVGDVRFAGVSANGALNYNTTTSTSSSTCYGHWFTTSGNVCNYDGTAAIYSEMYTDTFRSKVGQYPARLTRGKTYTFRQAIVYTHTDKKLYKAIMEIHLTII